MKKISTLCLTLVMLLMVMMHVAPNAQAAEGEKAKLTYTIVNKTNPNGTNSATVEVTLGNEVGISLGVNEQFGYFVHAGDMIKDASQTFIASASNHVVVVMKESESDTVATFVDTNGEFLGAIYNPASDSESLEISVSKPGFNFDGFDDLEAGVDKVYVAKYSRTNQSAINVIVDGGSKDLDVVKYNDIVTVTPNDSGFSYWADSDGQVVSRQENYTFTALQDVELTAVFDGPVPSEPVVYLSNVTGISPDTKSFLGYVEGDFVEYGLLASDKEEVLTLETEDVTVIPSKALHPETNEFLRSIPNDTNLKSFRAYAKLAGGEVYYSDNNFLIVLSDTSLEYETGFESSEGFTAGTAYNNNEENLVGPENNQWAVRYGTPSTTAAIIDAQSLQMRWYRAASGSHTTDPIYAYTNFVTENATKITFFAANHGQGSNVEVSISIDGGATWIEPEVFNLTNSSTEFTYEVPEAHQSENVQFKFTIVVKEPIPTEDDRLYIDGVKIYTRSILDTKLYQVDIFEDEILLDTLYVSADNPLNEFALPTKEGYSLTVLLDANNEAFDIETPITKHMTLTAEFEVNEYTLIFDSNGGTNVDSITQNFGTEVTAPSEPTREGYTFTGWSPELPLTMPSSNQEFIAQWTINSYTITFNVNSGNPIEPMDVKYNEALTIEAATHPTLYFSGWYEDSDFTIPFERLLMPANDLTLYAKWSEEAQEFTVIFETNDGTELEPLVVESGISITALEEPTRDGFNFVGWYIYQALSVKLTFPFEVVSDMTLYAKWDEVPVIIHQSDFGKTDGWGAYSLRRNQDVVTGPDDPSDSETTSWDILGGNVNNNGWDYIRMGGKAASNLSDPQAYLKTNFTFSATVDNIVINIVGLDSATGNETIYLQTSTDGENWNTVASKEIIATGDLVLNNLDIQSGNYFRFVFERDSTSSNRGTDVKLITFNRFPQ